MFQQLPVDLISHILVKALQSSPQAPGLPLFAFTCKLFHVLAVESIDWATADGICGRLQFLPCSTALTTLSAPCQQNPDDESLLAVIRCLPQLEDITLEGPHEFPMTLDALQTCPHLKTIRAYSCTPPSLQAFTAVQTLETLDIGLSPGVLCLRNAAHALTPCTSLRRLALFGIYCADPAPLLALTGLTHLDLFFLPGDPVSWDPPDSDRIELSPNLRELVLRGCCPFRMQRLWDALRASEVRSLWLQHIPPSPVLLDMRHLSDLSLEPPEGGFEYVRGKVCDLTACLPRLRNLTRLHLVDWHDGSDAARNLPQLLGVLAQCSALWSLKLSGDAFIACEGAVDVCLAMLKNQWGRLEICANACDERSHALLSECAVQRGVVFVSCQKQF